MIDTVIFDIGNVLMDFDYMPFIRRLLGDEETVKRVNEAIWYSGYWDELDRGEDTDEMLQKMIEKAPEYEKEIRLTFDSIGECMDSFDYSVPWVRSLQKRGYRVLYLSNYSPHTMAANLSALKAVPFMDGGIFSCDVKMIKPDPRIFELLIEKFDLDPSRCIFIDDNKNNCETAEKLGIKAIRFNDYKSASAELDWELGKSQKMDKKWSVF